MSKSSLMSLFLLFLVGWVCTGPAAGRTWYVDPVNGSNDWNGSWMSQVGDTSTGPLLSLGAAVWRGKEGDLIVLMDGVYWGPDDITQDILGMLAEKGFYVYSFNGPEDCVLVLNQTIWLSGNRVTVFDGVTFTESTVSDARGALRVDNLPILFENCRFEGFQKGGDYLIYNPSGYLIMNNCRFSDNRNFQLINTGDSAEQLDLNQCEFEYNECARAIAVYNCPDVSIRHCTFAYNTYSESGMAAIYLSNNPGAKIQHCVFENNSVNGPFTAIQLVGRNTMSTAKPAVENCIFRGNVSAARMRLIDVTQSADVRIADCSISGNQTTTSSECIGINCEGTYVEILDTQIDNLSSAAPTLPQGIGISLTGCSNTLVRGCRIDQNHAGIRLVASQPYDPYDRWHQRIPVTTEILDTQFNANTMTVPVIPSQAAAIWVTSIAHPITIGGCTFRDNACGLTLAETPGENAFVVKNSLFDNCDMAFRLDSHPQHPVQVNNCTIVNTTMTFRYVIMNNCIIRQTNLWNTDPLLNIVNYCCLPGDWSGLGTGNFIADPLFVDPENGDYHLRSPWGRYDPVTGLWTEDIFAISPCIDAGNPSDSVGQEPYGSGGRINLGMYGGTPEASKSTICTGGLDGTGKMLSDFNRDCVVNLADYAIFASEWMHSTVGYQYPWIIKEN